MGDDLCRLPLAEVAALIRARRVSAVETATACLDRAEQLQQLFNIFITIDHEGALTAARAADADAARDRWRGPLHGVPLAHKDMFYREDRVVTCGSRLRADFRPNVTSTIVRRLEAGGVVDLGGLNMSEFACNPYGLKCARGAGKESLECRLAMPADPRQAPPRRWPRASPMARLVRIRAAQSGFPQRPAAWSVYCRPTAGSHAA